MPSMKCSNCGKVRKCKMYVTSEPPEGAVLGDGQGTFVTAVQVKVEYICNPCARELGHIPRKEG